MAFLLGLAGWDTSCSPSIRAYRVIYKPTNRAFQTFNKVLKQGTMYISMQHRSRVTGAGGANTCTWDMKRSGNFVHGPQMALPQ